MQVESNSIISEEHLDVFEFLELVRKERVWSINEMAKRFGVHYHTLRSSLADRQMSKKLARRLEKEFEIPAIYWLSEDQKLPQGMRKFALAKINGTSGQESLVDFRIEQVFSSGGIQISNLAEDLIKSASVDLTIGHFCNSHYMKKKSDPSKIKLRPGKSANIQIAQSVRFKSNYFARVGTKTTFAKKGILVLVGHQIDPGYEGFLNVRAINLSDRTVQLRRSDPIISLELIRLCHAPDNPYADITKHSLLEVRESIEREISKKFIFNRNLNKYEWADISIDRPLKNEKLVLKFWNEIHRLQQSGADLSAVSGEFKQIFKGITVDKAKAESILKLFPGIDGAVLIKFDHDKTYTESLHSTFKSLNQNRIDFILHLFPKSNLLNSR